MQVCHCFVRMLDSGRVRYDYRSSASKVLLMLFTISALHRKTPSSSTIDSASFSTSSSSADRSVSLCSADCPSFASASKYDCFSAQDNMRSRRDKIEERRRILRFGQEKISSQTCLTRDSATTASLIGDRDEVPIRATLSIVQGVFRLLFHLYFLIRLAGSFTS